VRALVLIALAACGSHAGAPDAVPDASPWSAGPTLPNPRLLGSVAAIGARLVIADGFDVNIKIVSEVDALDTTNDTWSRLPDTPVAWTHGDMVGSGGSLYLLGGLETDMYNVNGSSFVLASAATTWTSLAPQPAGLERGAAGIVARAPYIYVIGGAVQNTSVQTVLAYNISNDTWTQLPDLPGPRSHPGAGILPDGTLLVVGGLQTLDSTMPIADVVELPVGSPTWVTKTAMPTARGGMACGMFGTRFVCAGGEADDTARNETEAYDWANDTWSELAPMPLPRAGTQGAAIGTGLYVPGGADRIAYIPEDTMDILTVE
jgi:hypothetical protein